MTAHKGVRCRSTDGRRCGDGGDPYLKKERAAIQSEPRGLAKTPKEKKAVSFPFGQASTDDAEEIEVGELVVSFPTAEFIVAMDDDTTYIYHRPDDDGGEGEAQPTQDRAPTHSQALKNLAEKYRKHVWW